MGIGSGVATPDGMSGKGQPSYGSPSQDTGWSQPPAAYQNTIGQSGQQSNAGGGKGGAPVQDTGWSNGPANSPAMQSQGSGTNFAPMQTSSGSSKGKGSSDPQSSAAPITPVQKPGFQGDDGN